MFLGQFFEDKLFLAGDHGVPDDEVLLPPGDDV